MQKEKKEKPEFKGVKDFILCTNINFDIAILEEKVEGIKVEEIKDPDDFLDMKNVKKTAIRYKLKVDDTHELYAKLKATSDLYVLAKALVEHIKDKNKKPINLTSPIFKSYHKALIDENIIVKVEKGKKEYIGKFHEKFINYNIQNLNDPNNDSELSESAKNLRKILQEHFTIKVDKDIEMNLTREFGKGFELAPDPQLTNLEQFTQELVSLIKGAKEEKKEEVKVNRQKQIINNNIDKLAGHVLVEKDSKVKCSLTFLDVNSNLRGNLKDFRKEFIETLNKEMIDFNTLNQYQFKINNFYTCEEGQEEKKPKLPEAYDDEEIKKFFSVLVFAVNQPNEVELSKILKDEIGAVFNLIDSDLIVANIQKKMLNWFKKKGKQGQEGTFFSNQDGKELLESIKKQIAKLILVSPTLEYRAKMEKFGIEFTQDIINELQLKNFLTKDNRQIFILVTEYTAIKLSQVLTGITKYKKHGSYIFIRLSSLLRVQERVIEAFKSESNNLLIFENKKDKSIEEKDIQEIQRQLSEIINKKENLNKKIVLITKQDNALTNLFKKYHNNYQETTDSKNSFTDLATASQKKQLYNFLTKDNRQIFILVTEYNTLSAIKLSQVLKGITEYEKDDSYIFIRLSSLLLIHDRVIKAFKSESNNLLIIEEDKYIEEKDLQGIQRELSEIINANNTNKIVLIAKQDNALAKMFKNYHNKNNIKETTDNKNSFTHLTTESQDKLLQECKIIVQGYEISFEDKLKLINKNSKELIDSTTLVRLINNEEVTIGHELISLGNAENYYIPRTFNYQTVIKTEIFKEEEKSKEEKVKYLLAISDIGKARLRRLVPEDHKISLFQEYDLDKSNDIRSIILNNGQAAEQNFKELCQLYPTLNIHWLKNESFQLAKQIRNRLIWQQSQGSISGLHQFIDESHTKYYSEDELLSQTDKVMIISDTAGMGKTTVLTSLSLLFKQKYPHLWIVRIDLNNFTKELKEKVKSSFKTKNTAIAFLSKLHFYPKLGTPLEQAIFKSYCQKMIVMFDGFDEISPNYRDIVIELVNVLRNSAIKQLWVTTRPNERDILEDKLQRLSYKLEPFSKDDQINFMTKFWQQTSGFSEVTQERLKNYAGALIDLLTKSIRYKDTELTGIPLQTRMLAEAFEKDFAELFKAEAKLKLPEKLDLTDLYERFLKKKYYIQLEKSKLDISQPNVEAHSETEYLKFIEKHQSLALYTLFPEDKVLLCEKFYQEFNKEYPNLAKKVLHDENNKQLLFEDKLLSFIKDIKTSTVNTGIIDQIIEDKPHFIHRTFAEYLVGMFLVASLDNESIFKFLLQEILMQPAYQVTRAFLNGQLPESLPENTVAQYGKQIERLWQSDKEQLTGMTFLHLAAEEGNVKIIRFFFNSLKGHENILKSLLEAKTRSTYYYYNHNYFYIHYYDKNPTALHLAAAGGYLDAVQFLVKHGTANVEATDNDRRTVLHWAAQKNKLDIVKWLVKHKKANVEATDKYGNTVLQLAAQENKWDVVQWLVEYRKAKVEAIDMYGRTVLHLAAQKNKLDIVKWLVEHGNANVDAIDNYGYTVLHWAAGENNWDVVKWLVEHGKANVEATDKYHTVLHLAAQENKWGVVKWLVERRKAIVEATDKYHTVLHLAAQENKWGVVNWLVERRKAIVEATDIDDKTPLNLAEEEKHKKNH